MVSEQVTPEQAEAYVREWWDFKQDFPDKQRLLSLLTGTIEFSAAKARLAAYAYTKEHEQKIAETREEIALLEKLIISYSHSNGYEDEAEVSRRILAMLEAQLADLLRGFKEAKP